MTTAATIRALARRSLDLLDRHQVPALLALIAAVHFIVNLLWLRQDTFYLERVPDAFSHFYGVSRLANDAEQLGPLALLRDLREINGHYSMVALLPSALAGLALGKTALVYRAANVLFFAVALASVYAIGRRCHGRRAGLLSAALFSLMPAAYAGWRTIGLDFPALCLTAAAVVFLLRSDGFRRSPDAALFGLLTGLATLAKPTSLIFLFFPAAHALATGLIGARRDRAALLRVLRGAALCLAVLLVSTAPYWAGRIHQMADLLFSHATARGMLRTEGDISLAGGIKHYILALPLLLNGPLTLTAVLVLPLFIRRSRHRWVILLWLVVPLLIHMGLKIRHQRYIFPLVPAAAVVIGVGLSTVRHRLRAVPVALVGAVSVVLWIACSFVPGQRVGGSDRILSVVRRWQRTPGAPHTLSVLPDSVAGYVCSCGGSQFSGPPTHRAEVPVDSLSRAVRLIGRRHRAGRGAIVLARGDPGVGAEPQMMQALAILSDALPRLSFALVGGESDLLRYREGQRYFLGSPPGSGWVPVTGARSPFALWRETRAAP